MCPMNTFYGAYSRALRIRNYPRIIRSLYGSDRIRYIFTDSGCQTYGSDYPRISVLSVFIRRNISVEPLTTKGNAIVL